MYSTTLKIKDVVFGNYDVVFENENPYSMLETILYDQKIKNALTSKTKVKIKHNESGDIITVIVDFEAVDEYDFSWYKVDEDKIDQWVAKHTES